MNELLQMLLAAADDVGRAFGDADVRQWPAGGLEYFCESGVLRESAQGLYASCPDCADGHTEPVVIRSSHDGGKRFFIWCPQSLRVEVQPDACRYWQIDPGGLAGWAASLMGIKARPKQVVPDRLWRLGRVPWPPGSSDSRQVLFGRMMVEADGGSLAAHVGPAGRDIILVPHHVPDDRIWPGAVPAVVSLSQVAAHDGRGVSLEAAAIADVIAEADRRVQSAHEIALDPSSQNMVRRQVKAEIKSLLSDDMLVAAYKEHGSYRKAAEALTEQMGQKITKDKVRRAVERRGGIAEVIPKEDSASVARTVASQPRDRAKKFQKRR